MKTRNYLYPIILITIIMYNIEQTKAFEKEYTELIKYAIQAPSGHNSQPWLFSMEKDIITIYPDSTKTLPIVDNDCRELFISLGCAAENLCIAATTKGYKTETNISEEGIIKIRLEKDTHIQPDTLFSFIEKRQTNRKKYNSEVVPEETITNLMNNYDNAIQLYSWKNGQAAFDSLTQYILEGNTLQMNDKAFKDELKAWMRFNKKDSQKQSDGLSYAVFGAPNLPVFISKPVISHFLNAKSQNKNDREKIQSSSHFVLFTVSENDILTWINVGRHLQRFLLKTTSENIAFAFMNQPCEIPELSEKIKYNLSIQNTPVILLRIGYAKTAPYSLRKEVNEVILPTK